MTTARKGGFGLGSLLLLVLAVIGIGLAVQRFGAGIGATANLNQGHPWGFWVGFHALAGAALAAGGFVVAGLVYVFGGVRYRPLARPAIVTALLGYLVFICALLVDLGRPWAVWRQIIHWQPDSPLFVVGMCTLFGTAFLFLAVLPIFFERFNHGEAHKAWMSMTPWLAILLLVAFAALLTHHQHNWAIWVVILAVLLMLFEVLVNRGVIPRGPKVPTLLIVAGIIVSTLHQGSLGTLFLLTPHKLSPIWWSPWLPVLFLISAVMAGMAMVILESTLSAKFFGHQAELPLLQGMGKALSWTILLYLAVRGVDLVIRGVGPELLSTSSEAIWFWIEIAVGLLIPLAVLLTPGFAASGRGLFWAGLLVVAGLIINRLNVAITGISARYETYYPHWREVAISVGIVSAGILGYLVLCKIFPVFREEHSPTAEA